MEKREPRKLSRVICACSTQEPSPEQSEKEPTLDNLSRRCYSFDLSHSEGKNRTEVVEAVSQLLSEFFTDFANRKQHRLKRKNPYEDLQRYTLKVDRHYRQKLRQTVSDLSKTSLETVLYENFLESADLFVKNLWDEINEMKGMSRVLRIICVNEAYSCLINAIKEIKNIVAPVCKDFSLIMKGKFNHDILRKSCELTEFAYHNEDRHWAVKEFLYIEKEILSCLSDTSESDDPQENLNKMSIDDLVAFIDYSPGKKKNKKKKEKSDDVVEMFRKKIENASASEQKLKPCISQEYLDLLRRKIIH